MSAEQKSLAERIQRYLQLVDEPEFLECTRCHGDGYHHGFGENGTDPDWCEECGGPGQYLHPDADVSPDDLLREALAALRVPEMSAELDAARARALDHAHGGDDALVDRKLGLLGWQAAAAAVRKNGK